MNHSCLRQACWDQLHIVLPSSHCCSRCWPTKLLRLHFLFSLVLNVTGWVDAFLWQLCTRCYWTTEEVLKDSRFTNWTTTEQQWEMRVEWSVADWACPATTEWSVFWSWSVVSWIMTSAPHQHHQSSLISVDTLFNYDTIKGKPNHWFRNNHLTYYDWNGVKQTSADFWDISSLISDNE